MSELWTFLQGHALQVIVVVLAIGLSAWIGTIEKKRLRRKDLARATLTYTWFLVAMSLMVVGYVIFR